MLGTQLICLLNISLAIYLLYISRRAYLVCGCRELKFSAMGTYLGIILLVMNLLYLVLPDVSVLGEKFFLTRTFADTVVLVFVSQALKIFVLNETESREGFNNEQPTKNN